LSKKQTHILIIGISLADATAADEGKKVTILTKTREFNSGNTPHA